MTEHELRQRVCDKAKSWLGMCEPTTFRPIIDTYNSIVPLPRGYRMTYTDPWCAAFVSAVGWACGLSSIIFPECSCDRMVDLYKAAGRWAERKDAKPTYGDIVMYDWEADGEMDHVGIVVEIDERFVYVIEGNCSDAVQTTKREINWSKIRGYCLPDYAGAADTPTPTPTPEPTPKTCKPTVLYLTKGMTGAAVAAAQAALNFWGKAQDNPFTPLAIDGEYGDLTKNAVARFKSSNGMNPSNTDIGKKTWTKLLE